MDEYKHRFEQFAAKHEFYEQENAKGLSYQLGHNKMSDWTQEEYEAILTYKPTTNMHPQEEVQNLNATYPEIDWRTASTCVSPIQD